MFDLIIIGGGPAGVSAGVYAARKRLKTLILTESFGGQSVDSMGIENWIGTKSVTGPDLARQLENHLRSYEGEMFVIKTGQKVSKIEKEEKIFVVTLGNESFKATAVLVTSGSSRRKLDIPGGKEFENKGITYCASCDGPLFADQDVVVVGGGNAGFETAAQLLSYAKSVTLLHRADKFRADELTVEKVLGNPKMKGLLNALPIEVKGDKFVSSVVYTDKMTGENVEIPATGVFVEIGLVPNTNFAEGVLPMNEFKQIITDPRTGRTQVTGVWAAGDVTDTLYHQNNIASGDAVRALENIYMYIRTGR